MIEGNMSWDEAKAAMKEGKRVQNHHFCSGEFFKMKGEKIFCEQGYRMDGWYRGEDWQKTGWSIYQ